MKWHERQVKKRIRLYRLAATTPTFEDFLVAMGVTDVKGHRRKEKTGPAIEEGKIMKKTELDFLVERISRHEAPPIILPAASRPVDRELLLKIAKRLRRCKDVVRDEPCSPRVN